jgi:serine phosphatase RsbU (regulator of sigma subunit)
VKLSNIPILLLLISFPFLGLAKSSERDSLLAALDTATGKYKVSILNDISYRCRFSDAALAMKSGQAGLALAKKGKHGVLEGYLRNNIGLLFLDKSQYEKALENFIEAAKVSESISDRKTMAMSMENIGIVYKSQHLYEKALLNFSGSLKVFTELNDKMSQANVYTDLGSLYYDLGDNEKALEYFLQSLKLMEELGDKGGIAGGYNNVAVIYEEMKNYSKAMEYHKKSLRLSREQLNTRSVSSSLYNIALIYKNQENYENAIRYIDSAVIYAKEVDALEYIKEYYGTLSEIFYSKGDYKTSLHYYTLLFAVKDTLLNQDRNKMIVEMSTKYQTEKKERENQILKQQNDLQNLSINRQRIISYSIAGGLILVLVLAFFIYRGYRQKQKANILLGRQNSEIVKQKNIIEEKNRIVEEKNKDITDSIRYAKRLQSAILKPEDQLGSCFEDGFILFRPKDIVSGDFYWFEKFGRVSMIAAADCTGHGVPGAFMSIIGCNLLSQAVNEYAITQPAAILNSVNKGLSKVLQQKMERASVTDGMDIALCTFDPESMMVEYSGAYNPLWLYRDGEITEFKGDKFPVGAFVDNEVRIFKNNEIPVKKGDVIYLFSDGFADQFGGPNGKKFKYQQLKSLLCNIGSEEGKVQKAALEKTFISWCGDLEQVDDVLVVGVKI